MSSRTSYVLIVSLLGLLLWCTLGQAVSFPFVNFDDPNVIIENSAIEGVGDGNLQAVFSEVRDHAYLPFYYASYWLDYSIGGKEPWIYHALNLMIHLLNGFLLVLILIRLGAKPIVAGLSTAVFLIHPAVVESVVWASGRKDVLSATLMLGALLCWHRDMVAGMMHKRTWLAGFLLLAALFTKASVLVMPLIAFLLARWQSQQTLASSEDRKLPGKVGLFLFAAITVFAVAIHIAVASRTGTVGASQTDFLDQVVVMLGALGRYFANMFVPRSLSLVYFWPVGEGLDGWSYLGIALLVAGQFVLRKFLSRPNLIGLGVLWLFIGLIPFNNIFPRFSGIMADRYLYVSLMGLAVLCAGLMQRWQQGSSLVVSRVIVVAVVVVFAWTAQRRAVIWSGSELLWRTTLNQADDAILPYLQLGQVYEERAQGKAPGTAQPMLDEAGRLFAKATQIAANMREKSQALIKLASLEVRRGRFQEALDAFASLAETLPSVLSEAEVEELDHAAVTRATALAGLGRFEEGMRALARVGNLSSADREARHNRAVIQILLADKKLKNARSDGARQAAVEAYNQGLLASRQVIELWPDYEVARHDYVNAYIAASWLKDYHIDITKLSNALVQDFPESGRAYYLRARVLRDVDPDGALRDLKTSVQLDPYREEPYLLVVQLLRNTGRNKEAKLVIDKGLRSSPDSNRLKSALCETYVSFGYHHKNTQNLEFAAESAARARAILPDSVSAWQLTAEVAQEAAEVVTGARAKKELWERAHDAFLKLQNLDPGNSVAILGRARYHKVKGYAFIYTRLPKDIPKAMERAQRSEIRRQAMEEFLKAKILAPLSKDLKEVRALLKGYGAEFRQKAEELLEIGEVARASVELKTALHFAYEDGENHAALARNLLASMRLDEAEEAYVKALTFDAENLRTLFELGKLRFDRRQFRAAIEPLQKFLDLTRGATLEALIGIRKSALSLLRTCRQKTSAEGEKK